MRIVRRGKAIMKGRGKKNKMLRLVVLGGLAFIAWKFKDKIAAIIKAKAGHLTGTGTTPKA